MHDRYGNAFMGDLHRDDRHGFRGLRRTLRAHGAEIKVTTLIDRWAALVALDGVLDDGARLRGAARGALPRADARRDVNWDTPETHASPGAPPNGSDYVRLRDGGGAYLAAGDIESIAFDGAEELPTLPIEWEVDANPPGPSTDPALFSGTGDNLDRAIVREVDVPTGSPEMTFDGQWSLEEGYDYAYVQVSTDGGEHYEAIECSGQVDGPLGPAFNGESDGFSAVTCDLSAFAGQTIVVGFRLRHRRQRLPRRGVDRRRRDRRHRALRRFDARRLVLTDPVQPGRRAQLHAAADRLHRRSRAGMVAHREARRGLRGRAAGRRSRPSDRQHGRGRRRRSSPTTTRPRPSCSTRRTSCG